MECSLFSICLAFNAFSILNFSFELNVINEHSPQTSFSDLKSIGVAEIGSAVRKIMHSKSH